MDMLTNFPEKPNKKRYIWDNMWWSIKGGSFISPSFSSKETKQNVKVVNKLKYYILLNNIEIFVNMQ